MFKRNLTKWIPLGNFTFSETDFIVFVRGNYKTGMMYFKVKSVNKRFGNCNYPILPRNLFDVQQQWERIMFELNKITPSK